VCALVLVGCGSGPTGSLAEVRWDETSPDSGRVVGGAVELTGAVAGATLPLTAIDSPDVGGAGYAIVGEIRYEDVDAPGYLEMWSVFPDGGRYFSRTLAAEGPLAAIEGDSDWRVFELPFFLEGATSAPSRLELNAVLPSTGRVWVGPLRLVAVDAAGMTGSADAWWTDRTAGLVGGVGGALVGVLGAMIGSLASRGRARRLVLGTMTGLVGLGTVLLGAGAAALVASQPYGVTGSLLLGGAVLVVVVGSMIRTVKRSYAQVELRKMKALDAA